MKAKVLSFPFIYFSESGLFNGLQPIQIKNFFLLIPCPKLPPAPCSAFLVSSDFLEIWVHFRHEEVYNTYFGIQQAGDAKNLAGFRGSPNAFSPQRPPLKAPPPIVPLWSRANAVSVRTPFHRLMISLAEPAAGSDGSPPIRKGRPVRWRHWARRAREKKSAPRSRVPRSR
jgi:hypothetical protein